MTIEGTSSEVNGGTADQSQDEQVVSGDLGGQTPDPWDLVRTLNAKIDLMEDRFGELQNTLAGAQKAPAPVDETLDYDDDEPLTARKVAKIVQSTTQRASAAANDAAQRQTWDSRAKDEFPLTDPTFEREFRKQWRDFTAAGLNANHPKSVYQVAKATALVVGGRSSETKKPAKNTGEKMQDSEAPSGQSSRSVRSKGAIDDTDPRVAFYQMKGNKSEAQVKSFKDSLAARDAKKRRN